MKRHRLVQKFTEIREGNCYYHSKNLVLHSRFSILEKKNKLLRSVNKNFEMPITLPIVKIKNNFIFKNMMFENF